MIEGMLLGKKAMIAGPKVVKVEVEQTERTYTALSAILNLNCG